MAGRIRMKTIAATVIIGVSAGYLLWQAGRGGLVYYYSVDEFARMQKAGGMSEGGGGPALIRLAGVVKGPVLAGPGGVAEFVLAGEESSITVRYEGSIASGLAAGKEVIAEGRARADGTFAAERILTRCESKYRRKSGSEQGVK